LARGEIGILFGGVFASEYGVAMREAAEASNRLIMFARVAIVAVSHRKQQRLVAQGFAMHQRHGEEIELGAAATSVKSFFDSVPGQNHRLRVAGKGARGAAKHVARELIEHNDQGKQGLWRVTPVIELP
jgi:hypothetical protein